MAEGTINKPAYVGLLVDALATSLAGSQVDEEQVRGDRYRFVVISPLFNGMGHPERQRLVWGVAEKSLVPLDLRSVAMIITMTPTEIG